MPVLAATVATVLAHQGGWDEILMVLTPIALFAGLLWLANSRAKKLQVERSPADDSPRRADPTSASSAQPPEEQPPEDRPDT